MYTIDIKMRRRESTKEWVATISYEHGDISGSSNFTGKTEEEARNAAFAGIGHTLLATTWEA